MKKVDWIKFAVKRGDKYETRNFGWSKDINKAYLYAGQPILLSPNLRVVEIKLVREEVK